MAAVDFLGEGDEERITGKIYNFRRGVTRYPVPGSEVFAVSSVDMKQVYAADSRAHARQERGDELHEAAFHIARAEIVDERFPVLALPGDVVEHGKEHQALHVHIGPSGAADDVLEFGDFNPLPETVKRVHNDGRGRQVESLGKRRRGDRHLQHIVAQQALDLLAVRGRKRAMV